MTVTRATKKLLMLIVKLLLIVYVLICVIIYFFQEKMIFFPEKLGKDYKFRFNQPFEELTITTKDNKSLNAVLFKADQSKGLIFYLHGNAGSIDSWGEVAQAYRELNYDVLMLDYRGYGKSEGAISSQQQLFDDVQTTYDEVKKRYSEDKIVVLGYSLGSGPAARLASVNHPRLLILQAPYYSLTDMMKHSYPVIPTFLLKYKLETNRYIKECKMPAIIFHGDRDEVIYYQSSVKLKKWFKAADTLVTLTGQAHNGMTDNIQYRRAIAKLLN